MEILIATGRLAENTVRKAAGEKADVLVADIDIAAFITPPKKLTRAFEEAGLSKNMTSFCFPDLYRVIFQRYRTSLTVKSGWALNMLMTLALCSVLQKKWSFP